MLEAVGRESSLADVVDALTAEFAGVLAPRAVCAAVRHARRQLEINGSVPTPAAVEALARTRLEGLSFRARHAL